MGNCIGPFFSKNKTLFQSGWDIRIVTKGYDEMFHFFWKK